MSFELVENELRSLNSNDLVDILKGICLKGHKDVVMVSTNHILKRRSNNKMVISTSEHVQPRTRVLNVKPQSSGF